MTANDRRSSLSVEKFAAPGWRRYAVIVLILAFCAPASAGADAPLRNTYWKLTHIGGAPARSAARQREAHLIFAAQEQRVSGSGGCNRITGGFELAGDRLHLGRIVATRMACAEGMEQEQRFLKSLADVEHYRIDGDRLELLDESGVVVARFTAVALR